MRNVILSLLTLSSVVLCAQNNKDKADDAARIVLNTFVPEQIEGLTSIAKGSLENKLSQIASSNGMGGTSYNPRFIITANVVVLSKDITPTAPPMQAFTLEVSLFIGDGIDGKKFASHAVTLKGVGVNESKAYISALRTLNVNDSKIRSFVESAKSRIIEYYNSNCDFIIKEAQTRAVTKEFDYAIYKLTSIPDVCQECYMKGMDAVAPIYKQKIDSECKVKLTKANSIWNAGQNLEAAEEVAKILGTIDPDAEGYDGVVALGDKVQKRMIEVDARDWELNLQQKVDLQQDMIEMYKEVGMAYGNGQPKEISYNVTGWW